MASLEEIPLISNQVTEIYTWVSFSVICQIINIFGIVTNIINIICFVKQGFEDSVNVSLLGLAVSDLGSLVTRLWSCISMTPAMGKADLPFDPLGVAYLTSAMLMFAFTRVSACITAIITLERCLCITAPLKIKNLITPKRATVIIVCVFVIFVFSGSPVYAVNRIGIQFSVTKNKTLYGLVSAENKENVEKFTFAINNFIIPFCAFVIIVVSTSILSYKLRKSTQWRQKTVNSKIADRISSRNKKVASMVVMISSLFIVCFIPVNIFMLALGLIPSLYVTGKYFNLSTLICGLGYIMESINASMNIFIYYHMSSKYRDNFYKIASDVKHTYGDSGTEHIN